jgi:hypothetical protein
VSLEAEGNRVMLKKEPLSFAAWCMDGAPAVNDLVPQ